MKMAHPVLAQSGSAAAHSGSSRCITRITATPSARCRSASVGVHAGVHAAAVPCRSRRIPTTLDSHLQQHGDPSRRCMVEPMLQGAGGMIVWPAESLARRARSLCDRNGVLMIADEVLTGFGRTGRMFACEHAAVTPDIICLSKALTARIPADGVTAATNAVYDAFLSDDRTKTFFHGHSFTANPLACAVALASLDLFEEGACSNASRASNANCATACRLSPVFPQSPTFASSAASAWSNSNQTEDTWTQSGRASTRNSSTAAYFSVRLETSCTSCRRT